MDRTRQRAQDGSQDHAAEVGYLYAQLVDAAPASASPGETRWAELDFDTRNELRGILPILCSVISANLS